MYWDKIKTVDELAGIVREYQSQGKKVVTTNGCFDLFHSGHLRYLTQAKTYGDVLVVGVNADDTVRRLKGHRRPLVSEEERVSVIAGLECVDYAFIFPEENPVAFLRKLKPNIHVKGGDYKEIMDQTPEFELRKEFPLELVTTETYGNTRTTQIVRRLLEVYDKLSEERK